MKNNQDPLQEPRFAELLSRLRRQETPKPSDDFTRRTLERLRQKPTMPGRHLNRAWRAVAAIALLVGAILWMNRLPPRSDCPASVDILMAAQRSDGGWAADTQNLRPRYDTGVTALALLALMQAEPAVLQGPRAAAIRSGIAHLLRQQQVDGHFGEDFSGARFTQYLVGMALKSAARLPGADPAWRIAAEQIQSHLPSETQMARLNNGLAHPIAFPSRWADAGGPVTVAAMQLLNSAVQNPMCE